MTAAAGLDGPSTAPWPTGAGAGGRGRVPVRPDRLVDPVVGLVRRVVPVTGHPELPRSYRCRVAEVADTRQFAVWLADRIAAGTSFGDDRAAHLAAIGEAVERYCGNNIPADLPLLRAAELPAGDRVLTPAELPVFAPAQFDRPGFPYRPWSPELPIRWVRGRDEDGRPCWAPGSWVYLNWHQGRRRDDPRINHLHYAGIACGQGLTDAADRALTECLERDALVAWWTLRLPAVPVDPWSVPALRRAWRGCPLRVRLVALPGGFGLPVFGALIWDGRRHIPAAGFSAGTDPARAAAKAVQEALQVWVASRGLLDPDGASLRAVRHGIFARGAYLPFRADRRYLDSAGPEFEQVRDLAAQTQLWLDRRLHPMLHRFSPPGPLRAIGDLAGDAGGLGAARAALRAAGHRIVTVDLTTDDVRSTGLAVARVLVSGLLVNSPAAYPYLGTPRLGRLAATYGRLAGGRPDVTRVPPPHN